MLSLFFLAYCYTLYYQIGASTTSRHIRANRSLSNGVSSALSTSNNPSNSSTSNPSRKNGFPHN